jgi:hypothetical protein
MFRITKTKHEAYVSADIYRTHDGARATFPEDLWCVLPSGTHRHWFQLAALCLRIVSEVKADDDEDRGYQEKAREIRRMFPKVRATTTQTNNSRLFGLSARHFEGPR